MAVPVPAAYAGAGPPAAFKVVGGTPAGDGYILRCDWSTFGTRDEMKYSEIAPEPLRRSP